MLYANSNMFVHVLQVIMCTYIYLIMNFNNLSVVDQPSMRICADLKEIILESKSVKYQYGKIYKISNPQALNSCC